MQTFSTLEVLAMMCYINLHFKVNSERPTQLNSTQLAVETQLNWKLRWVEL